MNHTRFIKTLVLIFVIFIFLFFDVAGQKNSTDSNPSVVHPVHPSLFIVLGILSTMFCLTFLILTCAKLCHSEVPLQPPHGLRVMSRFSGIDRKSIESLPFFRFSSLKGSKEGLECVVCLSTFEDSEVLRLLPKCRHAFHMNCIDKWLENHSSCPLCRYKFDASDITNFTYTNSLRYYQDEGLDNLEIFVRREHEGSSRSSRFSIGSSFRAFRRSPKEDVLIQYGDQRLLDKFKHKIIVSDIVCNSRWSDVNSSDLMFLNSEMLNVVSTNRFLPSNSGRFGIDIEQVTKVKEDMGRRRLHESKVSNATSSAETSVSTSQFPRFTKTEDADGITSSRSLGRTEKRSMSEITNVSRFKETSNLCWVSNENDEKLQSVWLPMAKRTVRWFANRDSNSSEPTINNVQSSHKA